jgi:flagellin
MDEDQQLILRAEDGRNIQVVAGDINMAGGGDVLVDTQTQVYRGGLVLQSDDNIEFRTGDGTVAAADAQMNFIGMTAANQTIGRNTNFSVSTIDVTSREGANRAIDTIDKALEEVAESRSGLGAVQNRMESTVRNLEVASENLSASRSRILDADFSQETAAFSRNQIMQQAGVSVLAQANQQPQIALALLS